MKLKIDSFWEYVLLFSSESLPSHLLPETVIVKIGPLWFFRSQLLNINYIILWEENFAWRSVPATAPNRRFRD